MIEHLIEVREEMPNADSIVLELIEGSKFRFTIDILSDKAIVLSFRSRLWNFEGTIYEIDLDSVDYNRLTLEQISIFRQGLIPYFGDIKKTADSNA
jgi:hypothetical protein